MKRAISRIIALCMVLSLVPVTAFAATSGTCGENASWELSGGVLTISGTGEMYDYTAASTPWYSQRAGITKIVVEEGITAIGGGAFCYHYNAVEAQLPATLKEIGSEAFMACYKLERADLPEGLEIIRNHAFSNCKVLDGIVLTENLKILQTRAFQHSGITAINIPESITILPEYCFLGCKQLTRVQLHDGITDMEDFCFSGTESLESIELPEKIKRISWGCFSSSGLKSIAIPEGVTTIEDYAFDLCESLADVQIPNSVTVISGQAFRGTESLKTIDLPDNLKETGHAMFSHSGLEYIELPEGLVTVGKYTFNDCDSLTEVIIPDTVEYMLDYCFMGCDRLTTVELSENTRFLGWGMFQDSALEEITIPESCTYTQDYVFSGCDNLRSITYLGEDLDFGDLAFRNCQGPASFDLPRGLTEVSYGMFFDSSVERVILPDTVTKVHDLAFSNCDSLTEVVFPDTLTELGNYLFRDCDAIETVKLPSALKRIPWGLFWNSSVREIVIPDGVTEICNQAFWEAKRLEKLVVPASVVTIGTDKVFEGAHRLTIYCYANSFIHGYAEENGIPYVLMDGEPAERENPFVDVSEEDFFYEPVLWAVEEGITSGTSETTFSPNDPCQRAQVVTFLWRAMGCPEPKMLMNPFTDVKETDFYYKAVLWAVEQGITNGISATEFGPYAVCNRAQVVTFLYRALGSPEIGEGTNPFTDVKEGDYFYGPVLWAVAEGVTSGVDAVTFAPRRDCVRGQVVTFLYRALAE